MSPSLTPASIPAFAPGQPSLLGAQAALYAGLGATLFGAPDLTDAAAVAEKVAESLPQDYEGDLLADLTAQLASFAAGPIAPNPAEVAATAAALSSKMLMPSVTPPTDPAELAVYAEQLVNYRAEAATALATTLPATLAAMAGLAPKAVAVAQVVETFVLAGLNELVNEANTQIAALQAEVQQLREEIE